MQDSIVVTGWKRFTDKLKSMVISGEKPKSNSQTADVAHGNVPQSDRPESGGGRSGNRRIM